MSECVGACMCSRARVIISETNVDQRTVTGLASAPNSSTNKYNIPRLDYTGQC